MVKRQRRNHHPDRHSPIMLGTAKPEIPYAHHASPFWSSPFYPCQTANTMGYTDSFSALSTRKAFDVRIVHNYGSSADASAFDISQDDPFAPLKVISHDNGNDITTSNVRAATSNYPDLASGMASEMNALDTFHLGLTRTLSSFQVTRNDSYLFNTTVPIVVLLPKIHCSWQIAVCGRHKYYNWDKAGCRELSNSC